MPPKKDDGKKKKLTKKQKKLREQKKREEEERLRLEEEERRRIEEEKERIRVEKQNQRLREEEEKRRALEGERIAKEQAEFDKIAGRWKTALQNRQKRLASVEDWERYLLCSDLPNTEVAADMNSFLTIWRDSLSENEQRDLGEDFTECIRGLKLAREVEIQFLDAKLKNRIKKMAHHSEFFALIRKALIDTFDDSTAFIMQYSDEHLNHPADNQFSYTNASTGIKFGLWMNMTRKNLKAIEFKDIDVTCELALQGMTQKPIAMRSIWLDYDILSMTAPHPPHYIPLGGIVYIEILEMPGRPTTKKKWTIREVTELARVVKRKPYKEETMRGTSTENPVCHVSFVIPNHVVVRKEIPDVAWWDDEEKQWTIEDMSEEEYDPEKRRISFGTRHLTTALAFVQPTTYDIPFHHWSLTALPEAGKSCALFTITPRKHESNVRMPIKDIKILVNENRCRLMTPRLPELSQLNEEFLPPGVLLKRLSESGINLQMSDSDAAFAEMQPKDHAMERKAYTEMSLVAGMCTFSMSKWNHDGDAVTEKQGVFRVAQKLHDPRTLVYSKDMELDFDTIALELPTDPNEHSEWNTVLYDDFKCEFVDCSEKSAEFIPHPPEGSVTHLSVYTCLQERYGKDTIERMTDSSDMVLLDTIKTLLMLVRPLSW